MLNQEEINRIEKYVKGEAEQNEIEWVESAFLTDCEFNSRLKAWLKRDWDNMLEKKDNEDYDLTNLLHKIHYLINKTKQLKRNRTLYKILRFYTRIAAVLLLPLIVAGGVFLGILKTRSDIFPKNKAFSTIYAPLGSRVAFILPDSTIGMLNSGSHLTYSHPFIKKREVKLEGDAWFEVTHHEENPFTISAGDYNVNVIGTSLTVSAYSTQKFIEVVLEKGEVEFVDKYHNITVNMLPSEKLISNFGNIKKTTVDPEKYIAWTQGKLIFRGDPMIEVVHRLERWYNVKIILADKELESYSFRGTFEDDPLNEVLRVLAMTSPIIYEVTPGRLLPNGTYEKETIIIYRKPS